MDKNKLFPIIGMILIFSILFFYQYNNERNLKENKASTIGKIIKIRGKYQARYSLIYEYEVKGKKYRGSVGISPFECENGKKNCVGEKFTVYYSSENPENSRIDLEKYEKHKTSVEFIKLD